MSDALRRRCLYSYLDFPDEAKELVIVRARLPGIDRRLAEQVVRFVQLLRHEGLEKTPGIAETLDWARALVGLHRLDRQGPGRSAGKPDLSAKDEADLKRVPPEVAARLIGKVA